MRMFKVQCLKIFVGTFGFPFEKSPCHLDNCKEERYLVAPLTRDDNRTIKHYQDLNKNVKHFIVLP